MNISDDLTVAIALVALADFVLGLYMIREWKGFRRNNPGTPLNFRLIELWTASIAMSFSLAIFTVLGACGGFFEMLAPISLALFLPHQCAGSALIVLRNSADPAAAQRGNLDQFVDMFSGTLFGLFMPFFTFSVVLAGALVLGLVISYPMGLVIFLPVILMYFRYRDHAAKLSKSTQPSDDKPI